MVFVVKNRVGLEMPLVSSIIETRGHIVMSFLLRITSVYIHASNRATINCAYVQTN